MPDGIPHRPHFLRLNNRNYKEQTLMANPTKTRRPWRLGIAVAAALASALMVAAPAAAAPTIPTPAPVGSITVHKLVNPTGALTPGNGLENPAAPGTALGGIEFQIQPIAGVDLRTTAGWTTAGAFAKDPSTIPAGDLGTAVSGTTAAGTGAFTFSNLQIGAYLVTEHLTPAQIADGITGGAPFVVTVPITHPTDLNTWVYDVHVYPKNLQSTPEKTVDDGPGTTYQVGDLIDWTISAVVPAQATTSYAFKDALVSHLAIPTTVADNVSVTLGGTALVPADYAIQYDAAGDNTLLVTLNASGLTKLNAVAGTAQEIALTLTTEVLSLPADGIIVNSGAIFPNDGFPTTGPGIVTPPVESKFGRIDITKVDAETPATVLAGAEFKVFASEADAQAYAADPVANAALPLSAQQNGTGALVDTFTTDAAGEVSIFGLRASNWQDGAELTDPADFQNYWLLETKAPAGYELQTAPLGPVTVLFDNAQPTVVPFGAITIPDAKKTVLPFTGGTLSTWLFFVVGALVIGGGALLLVRRRARDSRA